MFESFPQIVATQPGLVELQTAPARNWHADNAEIIETEYSVVSAGTELAIVRGVENWAPLPWVLGYGSVGRVVRGASEGQRVFTYGEHARYSPAKNLTLPVPEGMDPVQATFARMAGVSITALRLADATLGDAVAVFGLGLVGNLAAQLFALAGCEVIGIDLSAKRREQAAACGVAHVLSPGDDLREQVRALTGGRLCRTVVEATGVPAVAAVAGALAGAGGEMILLGSPRGSFETDLVPFLNRTHLWQEGCVTIKGAHEWRFPTREDTRSFGHCSIENNVRVILRLIADGKLKTAPLLSHLASPADCVAVYDGLRSQPDTYLGVVFDWSKVK